jgi:hypothetical protein
MPFYLNSKKMKEKNILVCYSQNRLDAEIFFSYIAAIISHKMNRNDDRR